MRARSVLVVSHGPDLPAALAEAAAVAAAAAGRARQLDGRSAVLVDLAGGHRWRSTVLATEGARALADRLSEPVGEQRWRGVARGCLCVVSPEVDAGPEAAIGGLPALVGRVVPAPTIVHVPPTALSAVLTELHDRLAGALIRADGGSGRALAGAAAIELRRRGLAVKVWLRGIGAVQSRRALAGLEPGGEVSRRADRAAATLRHAAGFLPPPSRPAASRTALLGPGAESGQALPAVLGLIVVVAALALALVGLGGAATAKGRAQRAVDLAAVSAARSMRDDYPRLFVSARRADGSPDPRHLGRDEYEARAAAAGRRAAARNGLAEAKLRVGFPDGGATGPPLTVAVSARPEIEIGGASSGRRTRVSAVAVAEPSAAATSAPETMASGGGYSGPLAHRQGQPMRPDVATAFDRMARAAAGAGYALVISSGFRSDAEQAALFAANPDPRWVAPPGKSLHRCATELDLGPSGAYGWLAANAGRFGFQRRYSWEPWHFGYVAGPAPCSAAAERPRGGADGRSSGGPGLPGFVPGFARRPLLAAASRHGVSAALLAAQLMAESNFDPAAVSPAGAQGIAQFMPGTAAAYGLDDPFDVPAAIDAQARLMADLLARFGSTALALAAYNAGPAPVAACGCVPPYAETRGYVARILALLDGAGATVALEPLLEVRLIE
jgi:hypothetical protein